MANPAEIEVAVTAQIDQLQQALQQAEEAIKKQAAKIETIEQRKAAAAEKAQQRAIEAEQRKAAQIEAAAAKAEQRAQREAQRAVEIEQKKQAQLEALRVKEQQRAAALLQRQTEVRQQQALKEIQAQQKAAAQAGGVAFNPMQGMGGIVKSFGAMAIGNMLLDSTLEGVKMFNQGGGAGAFADAFLKTLDGSIRSIPLAGTIYAITEEIFYGAERAMEERRNKQLADDRARGAAGQEAAAKFQAEADKLTRDRENLYADQFDPLAAMDEKEKLRARDRQQEADALMQRRDELIYQIQNYDEVSRTAAAHELTALEANIEALKKLSDLEKGKFESARSREVANRRIADIEKREAKEKAAAQEAEIAKNKELKKQAEALEQKAEAAIAAKQAELDAMQVVTPADRQAQMMQSAQSSAASMMGSVGTALGEFKFAQEGIGKMALEEAKKQTEKAIKIEQLQADMKAIQQEMLKEVKALQAGVS